MPLEPQLVDAYLSRLRCAREQVEPPSVAGLRVLQQAHVERVPYETIWIALGRHLGVDPVAAAQRQARTDYGGYCFQLNGGLAELLTSLGYDVRRHLGRVQAEDGAGPPAQRPSHLALTVHGLADDTCPTGVWFVDAGLGDALHAPVPLRAGSWTEGGFTYALQRSRVCDGWRFVHDERGDFPGLDFDERPARTEDFEAMDLELSTAPDSGFVRVVTAQHRTAAGVDALRGLVLSELRTDSSTHTELTTPEQWRAVLAQRFGMTLGDLSDAQWQALWRRLVADHEAWRAAQESN